jgi:hypothetical protein
VTQSLPEARVAALTSELTLRAAENAKLTVRVAELQAQLDSGASGVAGYRANGFTGGTVIKPGRLHFAEKLGVKRVIKLFSNRAEWVHERDMLVVSGAVARVTCEVSHVCARAAAEAT